MKPIKLGKKWNSVDLANLKLLLEQHSEGEPFLLHTNTRIIDPDIKGIKYRKNFPIFNDCRNYSNISKVTQIYRIGGIL